MLNKGPDKTDLRFYNLISALLIYAPLHQTIPCSSGHIWNGRAKGEGRRLRVLAMAMAMALVGDANTSIYGNGSWRAKGKRKQKPMPHAKKLSSKKMGQTPAECGCSGSCSCCPWLLQLPLVNVALVPKIHDGRSQTETETNTTQREHRNCTWHASIFGHVAFVFVFMWRSRPWWTAGKWFSFFSVCQLPLRGL